VNQEVNQINEASISGWPIFCVALVMAILLSYLVFTPISSESERVSIDATLIDGTRACQSWWLPEKRNGIHITSHRDGYSLAYSIDTKLLATTSKIIRHAVIDYKIVSSC